MAQITQRRIGELLQALFRILEKQPEGMKAKEAFACVAEASPLLNMKPRAIRAMHALR